LVGVDQASMSDAAILERIDDGARQAAAGIGVPVLAVGVALLLWFATGLRQALDQLSGGDPLAHATVPAAALLGGLLITAVSLDVGSAFAALSDEFTPNPDTARALGMAGQVLGLTGLIGGAVLVAVTTRIAQQARALPTWAVWVSYAVAVLCLSSFWSGGMASVAFALWLIGAVIGVLRAARRTPPAPAVPAQGTPAPEVARRPPTAING
jgi:cytochrome bd-type quinol oxidase subunit 2